MTRERDPILRAITRRHRIRFAISTTALAIASGVFVFGPIYVVMHFIAKFW
jgi:hypothetical protein